MTIITYSLEKINALKAHVAELEAQLAEQDTRGKVNNPYPMPFYSRLTAEPVTLFAEPKPGEFAGIMLQGVVVHVDLGNSKDGYHRAFINGWIKEMDKLEDRTE